MTADPTSRDRASQPPASPSGNPATRRRRRLLAGAGAVALLAVAGWGSAWAWGNSEGGRAFLRERAVRALGARVGPVEVGDVRLDLLLRARLAPVVVVGPDAARPLLRADAVAVRPRLLPLLMGRVEPAAVSVRGASLWPARDGGGIGPLDLSARLRGDGGADVEVDLPGGGSLDVEVRRDAGRVRLRASLDASLPGDLPTALAARLPLRPSAGRLTGRADGAVDRTAADRPTADVEFHARLEGLSVAGDLAGPAPLGPLALGAEGRVAWDGAAGRLSLAAGRISLGPAGTVAADLSGEAVLRGEPRVAVTARTAFAWEDLVAALPPDLGPPPSAPVVSGTVAMRASVAGVPGRRGDWDVRVDLDLDDPRRRARSGPPCAFAAPFEWRPIDPAPGEAPRRIPVGPGNPAFVPYGEVPDVLVRAVLASEDGGFFGHRGFEFREIADAIADDRRVRGASTISQQLAKNLLLSPERSLARKVREALGTVALEACLPKSRLLEIYLNIAEWGPSTYGIGEAGPFWFGKDVRNVTPREAAFLATLLPAPRRFHAGLHRHGITERWNARIDEVLARMHRQGVLSDDALAAARAETLSTPGLRHPATEPSGEADTRNGTGAAETDPGANLADLDEDEDDGARPGDPSPARP